MTAKEKPASTAMLTSKERLTPTLNHSHYTAKGEYNQ